MNKLPDSGVHPAPGDAAGVDAAAVDASDATGVATLPTWAMLMLAAVGVLVLWLVSFDNGQLTSALDSSSTFVHELFHDSRHALGVPCH